MAKKKGIFGLLVGLVTLLLAVFSIKSENRKTPQLLVSSKSENEQAPQFPEIKLETAELEELIPWFKEKMATRTDTNNVIAVLFKDDNELVKTLKLNNENVLVQAMYNSKEEKIVEARIVEYITLSDSINNAFGDKDMVVLQ